MNTQVQLLRMAPFEGYDTTYAVTAESGRILGYVAKEVATNVGERGGSALAWVPFDCRKRQLYRAPLCHTRKQAIQILEERPDR